MAKKKKADLLQGTLDMLILKCLGTGPHHGYGVARWIQVTTNESIQIEEGSLYPALHRMLERGWLTSEWGVSESNRRAKFYQLTRTGRAQLRKEVRAWEHLVSAIGLVLNSNFGEGTKMIRGIVQNFLDYLRVPPRVHATNATSEIQEELEFHLTSSVVDKIESGLSQSEAQELALKKFGDVDSVLIKCSKLANSRQRFFHRLHLCATVALIGVVGMLAYYVVGQRNLPSASEAALTATGYSVSATEGDIKGTVTGEDGEPLAAVNVLAVVKSWPPNGFRMQSYMSTTRPDGSFAIDDVYAPDYEYKVEISAIADGRLLSSKHHSVTRGTLQPIHFELAATTPFELRFESGEGDPIEGVSAFPFLRVDQEGNEHTVYFSSADPIVRRSNESGAISMPHFRPGEKATVYVRFPDCEWQTHDLVVPTDEKIVVVKPLASPSIQ